MSSPQYKLTYFDSKGAAEACRFIFAYAKVPYEDIRVEKEKEWPALKPKTPFRQLPYLEIDGKVFGQSVAFTRLVAKKYKLAGVSEEEQAQVDAIVDYLKDIVSGLTKWFTEQDETVKAKLAEEFRTVTFPAHLDVLEEHLKASGKGEYFVPSGPSFADFSVASFLQTLVKWFPGALDKHPMVKAHIDRVHGLPGIKEWVAKRPETQY